MTTTFFYLTEETSPPPLTFNYVQQLVCNLVFVVKDYCILFWSIYSLFYSLALFLAYKMGLITPDMKFLYLSSLSFQVLLLVQR